MLLVTGSIYAGFATPTEAAALGVAGVVILAALFGRLDRHVLIEAFESTARTTAMFMFIFIGAFIFTFVISALGVTRDVSQAVIDSGIQPLGILCLIMGVYIVLGMLIDESAMVVTTIPVVFPTINALGAENPDLLILDPVAFGIMIVLVMQASLISPPVGLNLYVLQGVRKDHGPMIDVIIGAAPFFFIIVGMMVLVTFFPQLALWLPNKAFGP
jgi:TRAP-type mannitol/chloroaromatic compound transport system permease large subunit